jgi:hypothetical protein
MRDAGLMGRASIDWNHLDADDHENLEKLTAPYWAIDEARGKGQGEIGRPARASSKRSSSSRCAGPARACVCPKRPSLKRPCSAPGQSDARSGASPTSGSSPSTAGTRATASSKSPRLWRQRGDAANRTAATGRGWRWATGVTRSAGQWIGPIPGSGLPGAFVVLAEQFFSAAVCCNARSSASTLLRSGP